MAMYINKEDMELLEMALRDEVKLLKRLNQNGVLDCKIMNAEDLLERWLLMKRVYGYQNISELI